MSQVVLSEDQGAVRLLTLNRPERMNALNNEVAATMMELLAGAEKDDAVGAVVLTGKGRAFSAGADLAVFADMAQTRDRSKVERFADLAFPRAFINFPKPIICAINGVGVGWGATVPLLCDIRLMSSKAMISYGFVKVGVTPEFGSSHTLSQIVGLGRAMELVLTGREILADEALAMGLVTKVCQPEDLVPEAVKLGNYIAGLSRPAISMTKTVMRLGSQVGLEQVLAPEIHLFKEALGTPEHAAAVKAMMQAIAAKQ